MSFSSFLKNYKKITLDIWIIFIMTSIGLLFYTYFDKNKEIEEYLYEYEKNKYYIFVIAYYIVFFTFSLYFRYLLMESWNNLSISNR